MQTDYLSAREEYQLILTGILKYADATKPVQSWFSMYITQTAHALLTYKKELRAGMIATVPDGWREELKAELIKIHKRIKK